MKKVFVCLLAMVGFVAMSCNNGEGGSNGTPTPSEITYTTTDGKIIEPLASVFDATIVSNTYENGVGKMVFNDSVKAIGEMAFYDNRTLKSIVLPDCVIELGGWAFSGCSKLEEVTLSNGLKTIGDMAFSSCTLLHSITLPNSLKTIGDSVFFECTRLEGFYGKFASEDNRCLIIDDELWGFAPQGISEYEIPEGVMVIAHDAFYQSLTLRSVTIPQSVVVIDEYAFYYCESLKSVYCKAGVPPVLGEAAFDNYDGVIGCTIYVPSASVEAYKSAEGWSGYATYIEGYDF